MTVSIIVPTYNRTRLLMDRAIPSILAQTNQDWECHVIGDGTEQATVDEMGALIERDGRFRFTNLPHYDYESLSLPDTWGVIGLPSLNHGLDTATGDWIAVLADDDAFEPRHNEILVKHAIERGVDFAYGISRAPWGQRWGAYPPGDGQLANGAYVYRGKARGYRYDINCLSHRGKTGDWDMWDRMREGGVTFSFISEKVHKYFPHGAT